jgi:phosphate/sulfate permease/alkyl hydroperoxide reductase subunit AhpC
MLPALIFVAVCFLAYANGANDNFKGVASLFGSRTCGYRTAISWATVATFAGSVTALFLAQALINRFSGTGLVLDDLVGSPQFVLAVAYGAGATVILATLPGIAISTTHGLTLALVGAVATGGLVYLTFRFVRLRFGVTKEMCVSARIEQLTLPLPQPGGVFVVILLVAMSFPVSAAKNPATEDASAKVSVILSRIASHDFHPIRDGFTYDRQLNKHGVSNLGDQDWRVRTLAVRDLVRLSSAATPTLVTALEDTNEHVRHVAAMVLGITRATNAVTALENTLRVDSDSVVRSQAAIALGQIGQRSSLAAVQAAQKDDPSKDVRLQAEIAAHAIEHGKAATPELERAYAALDESRFNRLRVGQPAPDFQLTDTDGKTWRLSDFRGDKPVVLIWIFAAWCPVCHGEFRELIELRKEFESANIEVATLECHDTFPARVMVGKELEPKYWFSKTSFKDSYTKNIWWPHLVDRAGAVGAEYGVQPMAFTVHAEWINRPSVVIVDKEGVARFAYYGTFWGDRPSIHELLEMVRSGDYHFAAPKRLKVR